jgi:hypothetical protein
MLVVADRGQRMIPTFRDVSFLREEAQKTAENHQPHALALPMVKPLKLSGQEAYEVIELEVPKLDTVSGKTPQEKAAKHLLMELQSLA